MLWQRGEVAVERVAAPPRKVSQRGQAAVELVAVLPLVALLLGGLWQVVLAGEAAWAAAGAARAAARAEAVGLDARAAARAVLAVRHERGLRVRAVRGGAVRVSVRVPSAFGLRVGAVSSTARFASQR